MSIPVDTRFNPCLRIGKTSILRGKFNPFPHSKIGERKYLAWDTIPPCNKEKCPVAHACEFFDSDTCVAAREYIKNLTKLIFSNYPDITEPQMLLLGLHLVPLYRILFILKVEECGISKFVLEKEHGEVYVHPLLKEIRETIELINEQWRMIGLSPPVEQPEVELKPEPKKAVVHKRELDAESKVPKVHDPTFVRRMTEAAEAKLGRK